MVKECKLSEIRSLQKINWNVDLEKCKLVERAVVELVELSEDPENGEPLNSDQKAFVRTTVLAFEEGL